MFRYLRLRWKISRLERRCRAEEEGTEKAVEAAMARNASPGEIEAITGGSSEGVLQRKIQEALSKYLISEANRLVIPVPDWDDHNLWSVNTDTDEHVLNRAGIDELRSAIRAEKKARTERLLMWVPGITGIIGAAIGLAAILVGKGK
jgi:hypothetical protein